MADMTHTTKEALKACPFCGGYAYRCMDYFVPTGKVKCRDCGAKGFSDDAWNKRTTTTVLSKALTEVRSDLDEIDATPFGKVDARLDDMAKRLNEAIALLGIKP